MSAPVQLPKSWEEMREMAIENRDLKELITSLMANAASSGGASTAIVDASPWASALSVEAVRARAAAKPKGHRGRSAAQMTDSGSDSEPLPRRELNGAIDKKSKKPRKKKDPNAPKKPLTGYTLFVQESSQLYKEELADQANGKESKITLLAAKWGLLSVEEKAAWTTKAKQVTNDNKAADASTAGASPPSVLAAEDDF